MARQPRPTTTTSRTLPLPLAVIDFLLEGTTLHPLEVRDRDDYNPWDVFDPEYVDPAAVWRRHRSELLREWRERGGEGRPWAAREFEQ